MSRLLIKRNGLFDTQKPILKSILSDCFTSFVEIFKRYKTSKEILLHINQKSQELIQNNKIPEIILEILKLISFKYAQFEKNMYFPIFNENFLKLFEELFRHKINYTIDDSIINEYNYRIKRLIIFKCFDIDIADEMDDLDKTYIIVLPNNTFAILQNQFDDSLKELSSEDIELLIDDLSLLKNQIFFNSFKKMFDFMIEKIIDLICVAYFYKDKPFLLINNDQLFQKLQQMFGEFQLIENDDIDFTFDEFIEILFNEHFMNEVDLQIVKKSLFDDLKMLKAYQSFDFKIFKDRFICTDEQVKKILFAIDLIWNRYAILLKYKKEEVFNHRLLNLSNVSLSKSSELTNSCFGYFI